MFKRLRIALAKWLDPKGYQLGEDYYRLIGLIDNAYFWFDGEAALMLHWIKADDYNRHLKIGDRAMCGVPSGISEFREMIRSYRNDDRVYPDRQHWDAWWAAARDNDLLIIRQNLQKGLAHVHAR